MRAFPWVPAKGAQMIPASRTPGQPPAAARRRCLTAEAITGPAGLLTVLELDPDSLEAARAAAGLSREQPVTAARTPIPVAVLQR
jgi:hypothetical protein